MNLSFVDMQYLDLSFHYWGTGTQASCEHEPYTLNAWGNDTKVVLASIENDTSCLGLNLRKHAGFDGLFVHMSSEDRIEVHFGDATTSSLSHGTKAFTVLAPKQPTGSYTGPAEGYNMNLTFVDTQYLDLSFHYWGTGTLASCEHEPYTLNAWGNDTKVVLASIKNDTSCLGLNLRKHAGFDGYFVHMSSEDRIEVHFGDATTSSLSRGAKALTFFV